MSALHALARGWGVREEAMKPYEETWEADSEDVFRRLDDERFTGWQVIATIRPLPDANARAALIAKAPEMARMLLAREWRTHEGEVVCAEETCTAMAGERHDPDCPWMLLMKAIGAR